KAGDADHLAELMNEDESDPEIRKVLITDRNANWAKWLKARLDKPGTVFVAVGAGHLAGPGSVQDQLAAAGVSSTRVQ
ncbi:MAG TPA: TraB/GumN family protein, partial [Sphingomicrobium sp.]